MTRRRAPAGVLAGVLASLLAGACGTSPQDHVQAGEAYFTAGKYREAAIEFRNAVKADPSLAAIEVRLADALLRVGNDEAALGAMERAAALLPKDAAVQTRAGSLLLLAGRHADARARAERALALEPSRVDALVLHANALAGLDDLDQALSQIDRALAIDPSAGVLANAGTIQLARKAPAEAEAAFRRAVAAAPASATPHLALAHFHWSQAKLPEAEAAFQAALRVEPSHPTGLRAAALFYLATNRPALAEPLLKRRAESGAVRAQFELASYYELVGRRAEAVRVLEQAGGQPQAWAAARTRLGTIALGAGDAARAGDLAVEVIARDPLFVDALVLKARALAAQERWDDALAAASQALAVNERSDAAHYVQGRVHASRGALDEAARAFERVIELTPGASVARVALARVELQRGRPAAAVTMATAAVESGGGVPARMALADAYASSGRLDDAEKTLLAAMAAAPDRAALHVQLGRVRQGHGRTAEARQAFSRALAIEPASVAALTGLSLLDLQAGRGREARARVAKALASRPDDAPLWLLEARLAASMGDDAAAEPALRRVLAADPDALEAYEILARLYVRKRDLDRAARELESAATREETALGPRIMLGVIRQVQGRGAEAEAQYTQALSLEPRAAVASNNLAGLLAARGDLDRALDLAKAAKAQLPDRAEVSDTLADVYMRKRMPQLAVPLWRHAVDRDPTPAYRYRLAGAYRATGRDAEAQQELERALAAKAPFAERAAAERELAELRTSP